MKGSDFIQYHHCGIFLLETLFPHVKFTYVFGRVVNKTHDGDVLCSRKIFPLHLCKNDLHLYSRY